MKEEKGTQQKKAESIEKWLAAVSCHGQRRPSPSCTQRPSQWRRELDSAMDRVRNAKAKVQKCEKQLRQAETSLQSAEEEEEEEEEEANSELKAAQENAVPKQPELRYAIVLRGPNRSDRYVEAVQPSGCGGMRRRLRGAGQKGQNRTLRLPPQNSREIAKLANPALVARLANSVKLFWRRR